MQLLPLPQSLTTPLHPAMKTGGRMTPMSLARTKALLQVISLISRRLSSQDRWALVLVLVHCHRLRPLAKET